MRHHILTITALLLLLLTATVINTAAFADDAPTPTRFVTPSGPTETPFGATAYPTTMPSPTLTSTITLTPTQTPIFEEVTLIVTKLEDTDDGRCDQSDCSLREAVETAPWGATIIFADGLRGIVKLTGTTEYQQAVTTQLVIDRTMSIIGSSDRSTDITIDGNQNSIIRIVNGASLSLESLTFTNGGNLMARTLGAVSVMHGSARITNCTFYNNHGYSGALGVYGTVTVAGSTFYENSGDTSGAIATFSSEAFVEIFNSTFFDNYGVNGSAVGLVRGTVTNSTFRGPSIEAVSVSAGAIISGNITLINTIVDSSGGSEGCLAEYIIDGGGNLQYPLNTCGKSIPVGDPKLNDPTDNDGKTVTISLGAGSAAIGQLTGNVCPDVDQRGYKIPVADKAQAICDIGSFQTSYVPPQVVLTATPITD
jgi:CSLREA domain-containing protein